MRVPPGGSREVKAHREAEGAEEDDGDVDGIPAEDRVVELYVYARVPPLAAVWRARTSMRGGVNEVVRRKGGGWRAGEKGASEGKATEMGSSYGER